MRGGQKWLIFIRENYSLNHKEIITYNLTTVRFYLNLILSMLSENIRMSHNDSYSRKLPSAQPTERTTNPKSPDQSNVPVRKVD